MFSQVEPRVSYLLHHRRYTNGRQNHSDDDSKSGFPWVKVIAFVQQRTTALRSARRRAMFSDYALSEESSLVLSTRRRLSTGNVPETNPWWTWSEIVSIGSTRFLWLKGIYLPHLEQEGSDCGGNHTPQLPREPLRYLGGTTLQIHITLSICRVN